MFFLSKNRAKTTTKICNSPYYYQYSALYWHCQLQKILIMDYWKFWQATHIEKVLKLLHTHIYQKILGIVPWPPYFHTFHLKNGSAFGLPRLCFLKLLKTILGCKKLVSQQDAHTLSFCGHTSAGGFVRSYRQTIFTKRVAALVFANQ